MTYEYSCLNRYMLLTLKVVRDIKNLMEGTITSTPFTNKEIK